MKKILFVLVAAATLSGVASAQVIDPYANVLAFFDFNNVPSASSPNTVTYCAPCINAVTDLSLNGVSQSLHSFGGPDGSKFRCFAGWDKTYDYSFIRPDLSQAVDTLAFDMIVDPQATALISSLSLDWKRPSVNSVNSIQASIFWEDSAGNVQYRTSGAVSLANIGSWNHLDMQFNSGSSAFPSNPLGAGETFHVELYAWGAEGSTLYLDNISVNGQCAPIPEPTGALLLGAAGMMMLLRRRNRQR